MRPVLALALALAVLSSLAACAAPPADRTPVAYACDNGQILSADLGVGSGTVSVDGGPFVQVTQAVSASGARYTGAGIEVWSHQGEISLSPLAPGEDIASVSGPTCRPL